MPTIDQEREASKLVMEALLKHNRPAPGHKSSTAEDENPVSKTEGPKPKYCRICRRLEHSGPCPP